MLIVYSLLSILHTRRDEVIISDWRMWTWTMNMYIKTIIIYRKEWFKLQFACPKSPSYSPSSFELQPTHCIWPSDPEKIGLEISISKIVIQAIPNPNLWRSALLWSVTSLYIILLAVTYIVSHQLHYSLFGCNFVEYLSATGIMTDKFTNIMTSHAQSLKNCFRKDPMVFTSSYLTIMCRFQNMNDIFEHFIFFFNKSMAIVPPKLLIGMNWAPR